LAVASTSDRLRQAGRWALAALALTALASVYSNPYFPIWIHAGVIAVAVAAAIRPREMLIALAATGPFVQLLVTASGSIPIRAFEALVLAFLAGWLLRPGARPAGAMTRRLLPPIGLLIAVLVASSASLALELHRANNQRFVEEMTALGKWYLWTGDVTGVVAGMMLAEGLALLIAVVDLSEERPRLALALLEALAWGGAAAAALAILLAAGVLTNVLVHGFGLPGRRFVAHTPDVNAAGSYFAMLIGLACGMAGSTLGPRRRLWIAAIVLLFIGLALSRSRSAIGATALLAMVGAIWAVSKRRVRLPRSAAWGLAIGVGALAVMALAAPLSFASGIRQEFTITSLRMLGSRPIFGIGIGRYYALSRLILTPRLGVLYADENAHDYFLQIAAELGIVGFAALLWVLVAALRPAAQSLSDRSRDFVSAGLFGGAAAFLVTSVAGHPFLVAESSFPFWILLGLAVVASRSTALMSTAPWRAHLASVAAALVILSVPFRPETPRLRLKPSQDGFGPWRTEGEGRVHTMGAFGALYVGPTVTGVEITMRRAGDRQRPPMLVVDQEPGWSQHWTVIGPDWKTVRVTLPTAGLLMPYQRINLSVLNRDESAPADPDVPLLDVRDVVITSAQGGT
jgi:O-antigen ligase/polysaccharide polymerase Wzy-like membrane protein